MFEYNCLHISVPPEKVELFVPELQAGELEELECRVEKGKPPPVLTWIGLDDMNYQILDYMVCTAVVNGEFLL